jgi:hypothetical protein
MGKESLAFYGTQGAGISHLVWSFTSVALHNQLLQLSTDIICDKETQITYLLAELSPSWEAANCVAPQELPSILWNPKVHLVVVVVSRVYDFAARLPHLSRLCDLDVYLLAFRCEQTRITDRGEGPYESGMDESKVAEVNAQRKLHKLDILETPIGRVPFV